jgi:osmoprotectant transport system permease protein
MQRADNPGREAVMRDVTAWLASTHAIELVAALGFENAYALAMTRERAAALGVRAIADLAAHAPELAIGGDYEFFSRPEWRDLRARYGLAFRDLVTMDSTLMYAALAGGDVDVISAFSTDGRIAAFDLKLLEDTAGALPPYDAVVLMAPDAAERLPGLRAALAGLADAVDDETMRAANKHVDLDGGTVEEAARLLSSR